MVQGRTASSSDTNVQLHLVLSLFAPTLWLIDLGMFRLRLRFPILRYLLEFVETKAPRLSVLSPRSLSATLLYSYVSFIKLATFAGSCQESYPGHSSGDSIGPYFAVESTEQLPSGQNCIGDSMRDMFLTEGERAMRIPDGGPRGRWLQDRAAPDLQRARHSAAVIATPSGRSHLMVNGNYSYARLFSMNH